MARVKQKKAIEVPAAIKAFVDKVVSTPLDQVADALEGFTWNYEKGEFYHWLALFNYFDSFYDKFVKPRADLQLKFDSDQHDPAFPSRNVIAILRVSSSILENCSNKHLFQSYEHLTSLLAAPDPEVVTATLQTLVAFVRKTHASSVRWHGLTELNSRLLCLAQGWGGKEEGLELVACTQTNECAIQQGLPLATSLHFEFYEEGKDDAAAAGSRAGGQKVISLQGVDKYPESEQEILRQLVKRCNVPVRLRFALLNRIRVARQFASLSGRQQLVRMRLLAFYVLFQSNPNPEDMQAYFSSEMEFVAELVGLLQAEDTIPEDICTLALRALAVQLLDRARHGSVISAIGAGGQSGLLSMLMHRSVASLEEEQAELFACLRAMFERAREFGGGLFALAASVMTDLIHHDPLCYRALEEAGLPESFLKTIKAGVLPSAEALCCVPATLVALCLNAGGVERLQKSKALDTFIPIFTSKAYLRPLQGDTANILGAGLDELLRHVPVLRKDGVDMAVAVLRTLVKLGGGELSAPIKPAAPAAPAAECVSHSARMLESLLANADTCRTFVESQGVELLLGIYRLPRLPPTFGSSSASQHSMLATFRALSPTHAPDISKHLSSALIAQVRQTLDKAQAVGSRSVPELPSAERDDYVRLVSSTEGLASLAAAVVRNAQHMLMEVSSGQTAVIARLGELERMVLWQLAVAEDWKLAHDAQKAAEAKAAEANKTKASAAETGAGEGSFTSGAAVEAVPAVVLDNDVTMAVTERDPLEDHDADAGADAPEAANGVDREASTTALGTKTKKKSPEELAYDVLLHFTTSTVRGFYTAVAKAIHTPVSRRRDELAQQPTLAMRAAAVNLGVVLRNNLTIPQAQLSASAKGKEVASEPSRALSVRYLHRVVEELSAVLFDARRHTCHTLALNYFVVGGGMRALLEQFQAVTQMLWQSVEEEKAVPEDTDMALTPKASSTPSSPPPLISTEEAAAKNSEAAQKPKALAEGLVQAFLGLLDQLASAQVLLGSPQAASMLVAPVPGKEAPAEANEQGAEAFVKNLQGMILAAVLPVWSHPLLPACNPRIASLVIGILTNCSQGTASAALRMGRMATARTAPQPDAAAVQQIVEMGFTQPRAEEALRRVGQNSVELAMEWLITHPEAEPAAATATPATAGASGASAGGVSAEEQELAKALAESLVAVLEKVPASAFALADLLSTLCSQNSGKERKDVLERLIHHLRGSGTPEEALASRSSASFLAPAHLLAVITSEDAAAREIATSAGLITTALDILDAWTKAHAVPEPDANAAQPSAHSKAAEVPSWANALLLILDVAVQAQPKAPSASAAPEQPGAVAADVAAAYRAAQPEGRVLMARLSKRHSIALQVLAGKGHKLILDLPASCLLPELEPYMSAIMRHILEDPATLQAAMEAEIRNTLVSPAGRGRPGGGGAMPVRSFLSSLAPVLLREPSVFVEAMSATCSLAETGGRAVVILKPSKPEGKAAAEAAQAAGNSPTAAATPGPAAGTAAEAPKSTMKGSKKVVPASFVEVIDSLVDLLLRYKGLELTPPQTNSKTTSPDAMETDTPSGSAVDAQAAQPAAQGQANPPPHGQALPRGTTVVVETSNGPMRMRVMNAQPLNGAEGGAAGQAPSAAQDLLSTKQVLNEKEREVLVQCIALKMLTDFTLMYSSCVGVLLKRDAELAGREAPHKTPAKGAHAHEPLRTGALIRHIMHAHLAHSPEPNWAMQGLAEQTSFFLLAVCIRSAEGRRRIIKETVKALTSDDSEHPEAVVATASTSIPFIQRPGAPAPFKVKAFVNLVGSLLSASTPGASSGNRAASTGLSTEMVRAMRDAGMVKALTSALKMIDLDHPKAPASINSILKPLEILTRNLPARLKPAADASPAAGGAGAGTADGTGAAAPTAQAAPPGQAAHQDAAMADREEEEEQRESAAGPEAVLAAERAMQAFERSQGHQPGGPSMEDVMEAFIEQAYANEGLEAFDEDSQGSSTDDEHDEDEDDDMDEGDGEGLSEEDDGEVHDSDEDDGDHDDEDDEDHDGDRHGGGHDHHDHGGSMSEGSEEFDDEDGVGDDEDMEEHEAQLLAAAAEEEEQALQDMVHHVGAMVGDEGDEDEDALDAEERDADLDDEEEGPGVMDANEEELEDGWQEEDDMDEEEDEEEEEEEEEEGATPRWLTHRMEQGIMDDAQLLRPGQAHALLDEVFGQAMIQTGDRVTRRRYRILPRRDGASQVATTIHPSALVPAQHRLLQRPNAAGGGGAAAGTAGAAGAVGGPFVMDGTGLRRIGQMANVMIDTGGMPGTGATAAAVAAAAANPAYSSMIDLSIDMLLGGIGAGGRPESRMVNWSDNGQPPTGTDAVSLIGSLERPMLEALRPDLMSQALQAAMASLQPPAEEGPPDLAQDESSGSEEYSDEEMMDADQPPSAEALEAAAAAVIQAQQQDQDTEMGTEAAPGAGLDPGLIAAAQAVGIDLAFLEALPPELRAEILAAEGGIVPPPPAQPTAEPQPAQPQPAAPQPAAAEQPAAADISATQPTDAAPAAAAPSSAAGGSGAGTAAAAPAAPAVDDGLEGIDPEFIAALPPDIREEVLEQQRRERRRLQAEAQQAAAQQAAAAAGPAAAAAAADMDLASVLASFPPEVREEALLTADEAMLAQLPPALLAEAQALRERISRHIRDPAALGRNVMQFALGRQQPGGAGRVGLSHLSRRADVNLASQEYVNQLQALRTRAAGAGAKKGKEVEGPPQVDEDDLVSLAQLLRLAQPLGKGQLQRSNMVYARSREPQGVPPVVARRLLDMLTYLARHQSRVARDLVHIHVPKPQAQAKAIAAIQDPKGKGKAVAEQPREAAASEERAIEVVLELLGRTLCRRSNSHLETALHLLEVVLRTARAQLDSLTFLQTILAEKEQTQTSDAATAATAGAPDAVAAADLGSGGGAALDQPSESATTAAAGAGSAATPTPTPAAASRPGSSSAQAVQTPALAGTGAAAAAEGTTPASGIRPATPTTPGPVAGVGVDQPGAGAAAGGSAEASSSGSGLRPADLENHEDDPRPVLNALPEPLLRQLPSLLGQQGLSELAYTRVGSVLKMVVEAAPAHKALMLQELEAQLRRLAEAAVAELRRLMESELLSSTSIAPSTGSIGLLVLRILQAVAALTKTEVSSTPRGAIATGTGGTIRETSFARAADAPEADIRQAHAAVARGELSPLQAVTQLAAAGTAVVAAQQRTSRQPPKPPQQPAYRREGADAAIVEEMSAQLEPLWQVLSQCIARIEAGLQATSAPRLEAAAAARILPTGAAQILPLVEAFFVLTDARTAHLPPTEMALLRSASVSDVMRAASSDMFRLPSMEVSPTTSAASQPSQAAPAAAHAGIVEAHLPFLRFAEKHRRLLNTLLRQNPGLLESSLSPLLKTPRLIEFDNKRAYFRTRVRTSPQERAYGTLRILVRREHVFEDSFHQLRMRSPEEMRCKLSVQFQAEEGIDAGGVSREWYSVMAREIFNPNFSLFVHMPEHGTTFQPNPNSVVQNDEARGTNHLDFFKFVGRIIGKALYDGQFIDAYFTRSFYKHMLGQALTYLDIEAVDPEYFKNLVWMLENDITDVLDLTFTEEADYFGKKELVELKPGGAAIKVTEETKREYVDLVAQHRMTGAIKAQINSFLTGFWDLIPKNLVSIFNDHELELLISGLPEIDVDDLRRNTEYTGFSAATPVIQWFWDIVRDLDKEDLALLVQFVTGTSKVPLEGFKALQGISGPQKFQIHKAYGPGDRLPSAHTCFNQLDLIEYETKEQLRDRLMVAIHEGSEGFGFG
ncbi:hypothetical protein WJX72_010812 [[Myrmecia] bisecta]|uniref:HECT-type E3 ubiquitin transferase n=1 Tax=[Myrmecia] bisecta TaxID=41462 RepID=A0AAW1R9F6_9CHLO